jgi:TPM domain
LWLISLALLAGACPVALAQGTDTVYDEADVLTNVQEQKVQEAFDSAQEEAGQPIYAFLVPDTNVDTPQDRQDLLTQEARDAGVPQDAGVIIVAPRDRWDVAANLNGVSEDAVSNAMEPDFADGDFASGLIAGADEIRSDGVAPQSNPGVGAGSVLGGLLLLLAVVAALVLFGTRRARKRRVEQERVRAEEEFAGLTTRLDEFDEKEQLVSGYWKPSGRCLIRKRRVGSRRGSRTPIQLASPRSSTKRPPDLPPILSGRER